MARVGTSIALAMAAMAFTGMAPAMGPVAAQEVRVVTLPPAAERPAPPPSSAANEVERVRKLSDGPRGIWRTRWDGKNRSAGDRAHKRWKRTRAAGRR